MLHRLPRPPSRTAAALSSLFLSVVSPSSSARPLAPDVQSRIGGKGTVRRKQKAVTKATSADDKKLVSTLKRMGVNTIPGIEEVSIVKDDGSAIVFANPKVQANIGSNTYVVSGTAETKSASEMSAFPGLGALGGGLPPAQLKMLQEMLAKVRVCCS